MKPKKLKSPRTFTRKPTPSEKEAQIVAEAGKLGCCRLTLEVRDDNPVAMALYRRLGFGPSIPGGQAVPHHFMERQLPP